MIRLLIVDDEHYIVDALKDLMSNIDSFELDVYCAYNGSQALDVLNKTKIDIVLTDINMPDITGLELQKKIANTWPRCKVIFLTGYNDFDYAQSAIRFGGFDYLLKTEGEDLIIQAIENAIMSIDEHMEIDSLVHKAQQQMNQTIPVLQREHLLSVVNGKKMIDPERMAELKIPLSTKSTVFVCVGRVDEWDRHMTLGEQDLLIYAIQNIATEYFEGHVEFQSIVCDQSKYIWIIQQKAKDELKVIEEERLFKFIEGTLDSIQQTCRHLLKLGISLVLTKTPVSWKYIPVKYAELSNILSRGIGFRQEILLTDQQRFEHNDELKIEHATNEAYHIRMLLRQMDVLEVYIENGERDEFNKLYGEYIIHLLKAPPLVSMEIYYNLVNLMLSFVNKWGLSEQQLWQDRVNRLIRGDSHSSKESMVQYLGDTIDTLFDSRNHEEELETNDLIDRLHSYINDHLSEDLSMPALAEIVYLNPYYLSRLYKQITGMALKEFITDRRLAKAKELLRNTNEMVQDISRQVGFESNAYFTRFFKKIMSMTPIEYRDLVKNEIDTKKSIEV